MYEGLKYGGKMILRSELLYNTCAFGRKRFIIQGKGIDCIRYECFKVGDFYVPLEREFMA